MLHHIKLFILLFSCTFVLLSCEDDLDLVPEDGRQTSGEALQNKNDYQALLAKVYAGISLSGQKGPSGEPDLIGLDEGFSNYLRLYWKMQELTTEEAVIGWDDGTVKDLHGQTWTAGNEFIRTMYDRLFYQIALCNEFLRQSTDDKLSEKGIAGADASSVRQYRAETRFMRALTYWHAMDLFGNVPFVTDNDPVGAFLPEQIERKDLFDYIESELLAIEGSITPARSGDYGRADQAAVWMLLAKLYLNAEVYENGNRYNDCLTYCSKIINAGYTIDTAVPYANLFLADNDQNGAEDEVIFSIPFDGQRTQSFGGMTFIVHASVGGSMNPRADFGINGGWFGLRTTSSLINKFDTPASQFEVFKRDDNGIVILDDSGASESLGFQKVWDDKRLLAYTPGQEIEIADITVFTDGYTIQKFRNITSAGAVGSDPENHPDTDFHMFRLADVYLMYAEATLRGANGTTATAVGYLNTLRERAYGNASGLITAADLTLDFVLDERARELYWEAHRRTDLIRFNKFTENETWPFKGNVPAGVTTASYRNLMPIPSKDLGVNTNLKQNPGY